MQLSIKQWLLIILFLTNSLEKGFFPLSELKVKSNTDQPLWRGLLQGAARQVKFWQFSGDGLSFFLFSALGCFPLTAMLVRQLVFRATAELGKGVGTEQVKMPQSLLFLQKSSHFSWINGPHIVASFWFIFRVLKMLIFTTAACAFAVSMEEKIFGGLTTLFPKCFSQTAFSESGVWNDLSQITFKTQ